MEICTLLKGTDLKGVQQEIRAAIHDCNLQPNTEDGRWDLHEALKSLLIVTPDQVGLQISPASGADAATTHGDLDKDLIARIPQFTQLSSEVRRALRTALFFHRQVSGSKSLNNIDLILAPHAARTWKWPANLTRKMCGDIIQSQQNEWPQRQSMWLQPARRSMKTPH
jgi:hypothetical protein